MSVSDNIRRLRTLTGLSQQELADIVGVSRSAVSLWEMGDTKPRMGVVQQIADHFGIKKYCIIEEGGMDNIAVTLGGRLVEVEQNFDLSDDELELIKLYRAANRQGRESIMAIARVQVGMEGQFQGDVAVNG